MEGISKQAGQFDAGNGGLEGMKHATLLDLNGFLCDDFQEFFEVSLFYCRNQSQRFLPTRSENRRGKDRMCQKTFCEDKRWEA